MAEEMVDWIDDAGRTLGVLPRSEIRCRNLLHRVSATLIVHPDGLLLVHRRTETKDVYPGRHDVFVGGTVASGETFAENAYREVEEEMGVRGIPLSPLFRHRFQDRHVNNLTAVFRGAYDGSFVFQQEEVAEGGWASVADVERLIGSGALCPDSAQGWGLYRARARRGKTA